MINLKASRRTTPQEATHWTCRCKFRTKSNQARTGKWCSNIHKVLALWTNRNYRIWIRLPPLSQDTILLKTRKCAKSRTVPNSLRLLDFQRSQHATTRQWLRVEEQGDWIQQRNLLGRTVAAEKVETQLVYTRRTLRWVSQSRRTGTR